MATSAALRITRLRTLIDHPATGPGERAAAQRMLDRILRKSAHRTGTDRTYGARHDRAGRHADPVRIAEMIGEDIALERTLTEPGAPGELAEHNPLREAPAQITYAVRTPHPGSIVVTIENIPPEWGTRDQDGIETISPALQSLAHTLAELMNAYNHDGTDTGKRFFGTVRAGDTTLIW